MRIIQTLIDYIFPPRAHELVVRSLSTLPVRPNSYDGHLYLSSYQDNVVQSTITENKYHHNRKASRLLHNALMDWLTHEPATVVFVPVPLSRNRERERGYNQVLEVLHAKTTGRYEVIPALLRLTDTTPQTTLTREERLHNMTDAFAFNPKVSLNDLNGKTIVILDDVVTTGATLKAARDTLAPHIPPSARLITLALAH